MTLRSLQLEHSKVTKGGAPSTDAASLRKNPVHQMARFPNLIIGAVNGHCVTGGFELALAADVLLAAANAKFRDTHAKFGLQPCWGLAGKLAGLIGAQRARYVSLTASPVDARTAARWGIALQDGSRLAPPCWQQRDKKGQAARDYGCAS